jgi:hypothetical protein
VRPGADATIPFRPDHGHDIADDLGRQTQPGYPLVGRPNGRADLRGVIAALERPRSRQSAQTVTPAGEASSRTSGAPEGRRRP